MRTYDVAVILRIRAGSYKRALQIAEDLIADLSAKDETRTLMDVVHDYEHDNQGQRVVYLPPED
jgi:hypothetical protein